MATLTLTILRSPSSAPGEHRRLTGGEITIGRGAECDWPLPDPLRSLSRKHCTVTFLGGAWQVRDLSGNGTFVNFASAPIGREMTQALRDGDRLRLGDYEIEVRVDEAVFVPSDPVPPPAVISPFGEIERPGFSAARLPGLDDPLPLEAGYGFGARPGLATPGPLPVSTLPDHAAASSDAFFPVVAAPADKSIIPADWYAVGAPPAAPPVPPPPLAVPATSEAPRAAFQATPAPVPAPAPASDPFAAIFGSSESAPLTPVPVRPAMPVPAAPATPGDPAASLAALLAGGELAPELVSRAAADPEAALRNAGALLRAVVSGMRALLIARGQVKREFRIEQTMLRQTDNNPLKFAASDEYALAALLDPRTSAVRAVRESIDDLTLHQVATLAATQAAAKALLQQFDPERLESEDSGGGLLPGAREKRLWEAYKRRHAKLLEQFEDDFESAFGTAFARAYEQAASDMKKP